MRDLKRQHQEELSEIRKELHDVKQERNSAISKLLSARSYLSEIAEGGPEVKLIALANIAIRDDSGGFLGKLRHELRTQNNLSTEHPLFIVQQEHTTWGMEEGYSDDHFWSFVDDREWTSNEDDIENWVREKFADDHGHELPELTDIDPADFGWEKVFIKKHWEFVTAHLTQRSADAYIEQNGHNLSNPRVYVESQNRCYEWNQLRKALMA